MSCGCGQVEGVVAAASDNVAMCLVCPARGRGLAGGDPERCGVDGNLVQVRVVASSCPRGRHGAGNGGVVRWLGINWFGVPMPIRMALRDEEVRARLEVGPLPEGGAMDLFGGCGCVAPLKRAYESAKAAAWWPWGLRAVCAGVVLGAAWAARGVPN